MMTIITASFPSSVVMHAMLEDVDGGENDWGKMPRRKDHREGVYAGTQEEMNNLYDLIIERCHAVYRCNHDNERGPVAAWTWVKKNMADQIKRHRETYGVQMCNCV